MSSYFFSGIAGAGMNPLARLMRAWGHQVSGSDRGFDQGKNLAVREALLRESITVVPQDGGGIAPGLDRFIYSAAVESDTPEMQAARALHVPLSARPGLLAEVINAALPGVAIAGTSGKSTITGMLAWILRKSGKPATVLGGAALALANEEGAGCFCVGPRDGIAIAEACESDGTLIGYHPAIGVIHNVSRDHAELTVLRAQFSTFARQCSTLLVNAGCAEALALTTGHPRLITYSTSTAADHVLEVITTGPHRARGVVALRDGAEVIIDLPQPGLHNLENALAAIAVALELGISPQIAADALSTFPGVARRFEVVGTTDTGIRVVDDYAHNAEKIRAAVTAAQSGCQRLIAIFQPHGYGPARFLRPELKEALPTMLRAQDLFCYAEIFYAGGTVAKDISCRDLVADVNAHMNCAYAENHQKLLSWTADAALPGDTILLMGARDPDLPRLARAIFQLL